MSASSPRAAVDVVERVLALLSFLPGLAGDMHWQSQGGILAGPAARIEGVCSGESTTPSRLKPALDRGHGRHRNCVINLRPGHHPPSWVVHRLHLHCRSCPYSIAHIIFAIKAQGAISWRPSGTASEMSVGCGIHGETRLGVQELEDVQKQ
jgi:hypothetical protein